TVSACWPRMRRAGIQAATRWPPWPGMAGGVRRVVGAGATCSGRPPAGWADTTAPAATTPSTRAAANAFNLVSIMVLHVLSLKETADRETAPETAAPLAESVVAARAVACTRPGRTATAGIGGRLTSRMAGISMP